MATGVKVSAGPIWDTMILEGQVYNSSLEIQDDQATLNHGGELMQGSHIWYPPAYRSVDLMGGGFGKVFQRPGTGNTSGRTTSFFDLFYNRIHYDPAVMNLGQLLNAQARPISIWNAFFEPRTLMTIEGEDDEGLELTHDTLPSEYLPLQEKVYDLTVSVDGPPSIRAVYTFTWDHESHPYRVIGERIVVLSFAPDLSTDFVERLTWYSTVVTSYSGKEQRMSLSDDPKVSYDFNLQVTDNEMQRMDAIVWGWQNRMFAVPVWASYTYTSQTISPGSEIVYLESTELREFKVDGLAIILASADLYEAVEIREIHPDHLVLKKPTQHGWTRRVPVFPSRTMRMAREITYTGPAVNFKEFSVSMVSDQTEPLADYDWPYMFKDLPVMILEPDTSEGIEGSVTRNMLWTEGEYSQPLIIDKSGVGTPRQVWRYAFTEFRETQMVKALLSRLRGTVGEFWAPTWSPDMTPAMTIQLNASSFYVEEASLSAMYFDKRGRDHIAIFLRSGEILYRSIISISAGGPGYENMELVVVDEPLPGPIPIRMVRCISFMSRCRFENDAFEFTWKTQDYTYMGATVRSLTDAI